MATVYKVEFELTSHWLSLTEEEIREMIKGRIEELTYRGWEVDNVSVGNTISISDLSVKKKA